jgi:hypothetical protein
MKITIAVALLLASSALGAQVPSTDQPSSAVPKLSSNQSLPTVPKIADANPEVLQLVIQDQWDRANDMFGGKQLSPADMRGKSLETRDEGRHAAIRKLLVEGQVKSGTDFWLSAVIFQHSVKPEDLMLAHILAVTATAKGNRNGKWLAAASLDRYLWHTNLPQIFGTQFKKDSEGKWTMEPYSRRALSDSERAIWCVVPLAEQENILKDFQDGKPSAPTGIRDCK